MQSHVRRVHEYLAVTCHLHFWHNDRDLLCATEEKILLPLLTALPEAVTSNSLVGTCEEN